MLWGQQNSSLAYCTCVASLYYCGGNFGAFGVSFSLSLKKKMCCGFIFSSVYLLARSFSTFLTNYWLWLRYWRNKLRPSLGACSWGVWSPPKCVYLRMHAGLSMGSEETLLTLVSSFILCMLDNVLDVF